MDAAAITEPIAAREALAVPTTPVSPAVIVEAPPVGSIGFTVTKVTPVQLVLMALGTTAFLYFARSVMLPIFLACVAGVTLKPLIRWLSNCHIPPPLGAAIVLSLLVAGVSLGFFQLGRPA